MTVCVCVCMPVFVCMSVCSSLCVHTWTCLCAFVCIYVCKSVCIHLGVCVLISTSVCVYIIHLYPLVSKVLTLKASKVQTEAVTYLRHTPIFDLSTGRNCVSDCRTQRPALMQILTHNQFYSVISVLCSHQATLYSFSAVTVLQSSVPLSEFQNRAAQKAPSGLLVEFGQCKETEKSRGEREQSYIFTYFHLPPSCYHSSHGCAQPQVT